MTSVMLMTEQEHQWRTQHESDRCDEALIAVLMEMMMMMIMIMMMMMIIIIIIIIYLFI